MDPLPPRFWGALYLDFKLRLSFRVRWTLTDAISVSPLFDDWLAIWKPLTASKRSGGVGNHTFLE